MSDPALTLLSDSELDALDAVGGGFAPDLDLDIDINLNIATITQINVVGVALDDVTQLNEAAVVSALSAS
jgi:hypothetical protein